MYFFTNDGFKIMILCLYALTNGWYISMKAIHMHVFIFTIKIMKVPTTVSTKRKFPTTVSTIRKFPTTVSTTREFHTTVSTTIEFPTTVSTTWEFQTTVSTTSEFLAPSSNTRKSPATANNSRKVSTTADEIKNRGQILETTYGFLILWRSNLARRVHQNKIYLDK